MFRDRTSEVLGEFVREFDLSIVYFVRVEVGIEVFESKVYVENFDILI